MKKVTIVFGILLLLVALTTTVEAQQADLDILYEPNTVEVDEEFSFTVELDNALGYNYFDLTGEGPDDSYWWGTQVFSSTHTYYTHQYIISIGKTGYHYITITAGGSGEVDTLTKSFTVYVEEKPTTHSVSILAFIPVLLLLAVPIIGCAYVLRRRSKKKQLEGTEPRTSAKTVLFLCPYCGAKNEQGITKCWKCHADI